MEPNEEQELKQEITQYMKKHIVLLRSMADEYETTLKEHEQSGFEELNDCLETIDAKYSLQGIELF